MSPAEIALLVDQIGALRAKIAPYKEQLEELNVKLIAQGEGRYQGARYDAMVSIFDQHRLDMKAARAKLSPQFIAAHTKTIRIEKVQTYARKVSACRKKVAA